MDIDFSLVLVIAVAVTGAVWLFDYLVLAPKRRPVLANAAAQGDAELDAEALAKLAPEPILVEYSKSFFPVLALVLVLRSFLVEPFQIPSGSMLPIPAQIACSLARVMYRLGRTRAEMAMMSVKVPEVAARPL
mgnify:CR=1 FL=1